MAAENSGPAGHMPATGDRKALIYSGVHYQIRFADPVAEHAGGLRRRRGQSGSAENQRREGRASRACLEPHFRPRPFLRTRACPELCERRRAGVARSDPATQGSIQDLLHDAPDRGAMSIERERFGQYRHHREAREVSRSLNGRTNVSRAGSVLGGIPATTGEPNSEPRSNRSLPARRSALTRP